MSGRRTPASALVDRRRDPFGAGRRLLRSRCRFSFPGTVYLIGLSGSPDQVLPFALAADRIEVSQALGIQDVGLRFANPTYAVARPKSGRNRGVSGQRYFNAFCRLGYGALPVQRKPPRPNLQFRRSHGNGLRGISRISRMPDHATVLPTLSDARHGAPVLEGI